ncbi:MAG TPA: transglycosylase domain-containing protein [Candidatus Limnocylindrales bacterium]
MHEDSLGRSAVPGARHGHRSNHAPPLHRPRHGGGAFAAAINRPRSASRRAAIGMIASGAGPTVVGGSGLQGVAHRRAAIGRDRPHRPGGRSRLVTILVAALGTFVIGSLLLAGIAAFGTMAVVAGLSQGLPDPRDLAGLTFSQPTVVYDRSGKVQLGRFQQEQRRVVTFAEVPHLVLDATTTAEDRTFWTNSGFDPAAIMAAVADNASTGSGRGASTITQQLVRARLLPADVVAPDADRYLRKAKELIQSARLTQAYPGEAGKETIITAYLNEIFYGHDAYGIAAAARIYFGVSDLSKLTPAQAALLAGLPKSPTNFDPYRYAKPDAKGRLVVPPTAPPVVRRNYILESLSTSRWTTLDDAELQAALKEPVVLAGDQPITFKAPHFTWQVRRQLEAILGSDAAVETGGYTVITTLNWRDQQLAEKWLTAGAVAPNLSRSGSATLLKNLRIGAGDRRWINALRGKDLHNGALVALDYRTGDVLAYVGSAGYYRDGLKSRKFEPKYDAAGDGVRQPGSAWKPVLYASAFDSKRLTPGSLLLDITTPFGRNWTPRDADQLDRGPVLVRKALQFSLNVPAIRAFQRTGSATVADRAKKLGIRFAGGQTLFAQAGLAAALGTVEVTPLDLTSAYGAIANGGRHVPPRLILEIRDPSGRIVWQAPKPKATQAVSAAAAFLVSDILQGNTLPSQNPIWSKVLEIRNGPHGQHRPVAAKTGTANDARDLATYGFLAPPRDPDAPGLAIGLWMGNSDHSNPHAREPAISLTAAAPLWHAFVRDLTAKMPVATFNPPKGVVQARIDAWTGGRPGPWTRDTVREWFISGTQPGAARAVDPPGLLYSPSCGGWRVNPVKAELGPSSWQVADAAWLARARAGAGASTGYGTRTAYFWGRTGWGGPLYGSCAPKPKPKPEPGPDQGGPGHPGGPGNGGPGNGGPGHGGGGGHDPAPPPGTEPTPKPKP